MRFAPYAGIVTALLFGALIALLTGATFEYDQAPVLTPESSALSTVSQPSPVAAGAGNQPVTTSETSPSPLSAAAGASTATTPAIPTPPKNADLAPASALLRSALVNILCIAPAGSGIRSISGSGVFIDSKGYVLTNAHVAQYFLLADRGVRCAIRTGSPAQTAYSALLAYLPSAWIDANATALTQDAPNGTGENDFAILSVTGSTTDAPLPDSFPSIPLAVQPVYANTPVVIASYGAQFLETTQVEDALYPTVVFGSVKAVYTFVRNTIDVLGLGGSVAAQEGSSGGGVADADSVLVGTITTSTVQGDTATRSLNAITASYIRGAYASATGNPLDLLLAEDPDQAATDFLHESHALSAQIEAGLR